MALAVEAGSLSSITEIAGNPPRYPQNPTEVIKESLVLYIARVPGSQDVILTNMKPRLKSVTAEDVINSLYYLHLETPSDILLLDDEQNVESATSGIKMTKAPIKRKLLPDNASLPSLPERHPVLEGNQEMGATSWKASTRPTLGLPTEERMTVEWKPSLPPRPLADAALPRRPLGPRPFSSQFQVSRKALPGEENVSIWKELQSTASRGDILDRPLNADVRNGYDPLDTANFSEKSPPTSMIGYLSGRETVSITLIRRDPTSGAQWNIGRIITCPKSKSHVSATARQKSSDKSYSLALVELSTPGYRQFQTQQTAHQTEGASASAFESHGPLKNSGCFVREVNMGWSGFWKRTLKQHRRESSDPSSVQRNPITRTNTDLSLEAPRGASLDRRPALSVQAEVSGSGFLSPWNTHCEFLANSSGRILKCKHILHNQKTNFDSTSSSEVSPAVSELRFNLPAASSNNLGGSKGLNGIKAYQERQKLSNASVAPADLPKFDATSYAMMFPSEDEDELDEDTSLNLGREKAGGGNRGKRVKLGKLIVHHEGLKMLDLVVAANMGIWWGVWYR